MMQQEKTSVFEQLVLLLVVALPLAALVWYLLYQRGAFNPAPNATNSGSSLTQQQPTQQPATITLNNPNSLPESVSAAQIVPFSFTLKNTGTADSTYQYKVYVKWSGGTQDGEQDVIDVNSIAIAPGASSNISESLKFETASATAQIYIELEPSGQNIHFALPRQ